MNCDPEQCTESSPLKAEVILFKPCASEIFGPATFRLLNSMGKCDRFCSERFLDVARSTFVHWMWMITFNNDLLSEITGLALLFADLL